MKSLSNFLVPSYNYGGYMSLPKMKLGNTGLSWTKALLVNKIA